MMDMTPGNEGYISSYTPIGSFWSIQWFLEIPRGIVPFGSSLAGLTSDTNYTYYLMGDKCGIYIITSPQAAAAINNVTQWQLWMGSSAATCAAATSTVDGGTTVGFVRSDFACLGEKDNVVYITDTWSYTIRRIDLTGMYSHCLRCPSIIIFHSFVTLFSIVSRPNIAGTITKYVGGANGYGNPSTSGIGFRTSIYLYNPKGLAYNGNPANPTL
jgi:hypothetical protein